MFDSRDFATATRKFTHAIILVCLFLAGQTTVHAQNRDDDLVELNLAGKVSLSNLVEAISRQIDVRFLYSADLADKQVTIYTPTQLPRRALPVLIGSLLKSEELAVVDSDVPGWKRIVEVSKMVPYAQTGDPNEAIRRSGPAAAVTQVIPIENLNITGVKTSFSPFLSKGANFVAIPESNLIIVTDYAENVRTLVELLKVIDRPVGQPTIDFYEVKNRSTDELIDQAESLLVQQAGNDQAKDFKLFNDASGKRIVVAGEKGIVERALALLQRLDTGTGFRTRAYRLQNVSADRIEKLIRGLVQNNGEEKANANLETTIDEEGNLLIVRAAPEVHQQIETLLRELDQPVSAAESPIQFYKLKNANAVEVLYSLLALQQAAGIGGNAQAGGVGAFGSLGGLNVGGVLPAGFTAATGFGQTAIQPSAFGATQGQNVRLPFNDGSRDQEAIGSAMQNQNQALSPLIGGVNTAGGFAGGGLLGGGLGAGGLGGGQVATLPGGARVSADVATNSLIVFAPSSVQPLYEKLIKSLDQRRPQVMIEAEIVAVNTSDNFSLGVEVSIGDRTGSKKLFKFTSFGLSEIDVDTGALTVNPSLGFNGVLIDPEVADVIVQALSSHTRSRVLASPKILVNDNQTGTLESIASVPFQSINTINTISSQSLGGSQEAGTIITVTPHINEDDHLQLEFEVEFSSFAATGGSATLPPPRQIDRVGSVVTIPDGQTIVVGGLKRNGERDTFTGIPWAEKIPVLRELTSLSTSDKDSTSFFLFIRPKILRDSRFRDLQYLSDIDASDAQIQSDAPTSRPILIPCEKPPNSMIQTPSERMMLSQP
ncbi:Type II secretion system protein D precursor [Rubripirellula amarantea]|uniref:Type II secretion system protein D n=1 Tax=Rubripirellula amarantea TaxID=2527999 RepID=A0A5C5WQ94_9BACT|nr:secretin N-terminal domain-containing protein [Rubripirellula amarantea]TWT52707.1 Type II secretion system protein D precursor [Rubripirellula amarantea]